MTKNDGPFPQRKGPAVATTTAFLIGSSARRAEFDPSALNRYDVAAIPGPPFDMFYHLEVVDRLRPNLTEILDAMRDEWQFLDGMET